MDLLADLFFFEFISIFRIFLVYINFYFILLFCFYIFILFYLHINFYCLCSIPQSVLIVDFSFIIVSILLFYFSVNLSLEIFRFLLFVAIFVVAGLIDYFFFVLSSHFYCFSVSFFLSSPLLFKLFS